MPLARRASRLLCCALAFAFGGCAPEPGRPNVLLISIDTARSDHFSAYGYERETSPALEDLAAEGIRFDLAYSATATTGPTHASLFTSLYPPAHGVLKNGLVLDERFTTLAELLAAAGYQTAGIASSFVLHSKFGYAQGFESWHEEFEAASSTIVRKSWEGHDVSEGFDRRADETTRRAVEWLDTERRPLEPFFLFVHYYDPHSPYGPPKGFQAGFENPDLDGLDDTIQRYDAEIAFVDRAINGLLESLDELDLTASTLVVVTADHGEGLMEHGNPEHGLNVYEEAVRVPLLMRWPGRLPAGAVVGSPVESVDLMPTIASLAGASFEELDSHGRNLAPRIAGREAWELDHPVFLFRRHYAADGSHRTGGRGVKFAIRLGNWKYILGPDEATRELYDLASDPHESSNLVDAEPERAARLEERIARWLERVGGASTPSPQVDPEDRRRLRALGYVD